MKALKEKRIGLRSLWRRGLVILSLFALVFASCNTTEEDDVTPVTIARLPLEIRVKTQPKNPSYEGIPVDITGMVLEARYAGQDPNKWEEVTDLSPYGVYPKYTQRSGTDAGDTVRDYRIFTISDGVAVTTTFEVAVKNLVRSDAGSWAGSSNAPDYPANSNNSDSGNYWAQGAQVYVELGGYKKEYRVDDFPDFTGIKLQGNYRDGTTQNIPLSEDMRWEIRPRYDKKPSNESGKGDLVISIGGYSTQYVDSLWSGTSFTGYAPIIDANPVSVMVPLDKVHHVIGIEVANPDELKAELAKPANIVYYWSDDRAPSWLSYDGKTGRVATATIKVTYSDNSTREMGMQEAVRQNTVYYNYNPATDERPLTVQGINDSAKNEQKLTTFWPNHRTPRIYFYYRGYKYPFDVPVYTRFSALTATIKAEDAENVAVDMRHQDNDYYGRNAAWFASQIKVVAQFTAYSNSSLPPAELELKYEAPRTGTRKWNAAALSWDWYPVATPDGGAFVDQPTWDSAIRAVAQDGKPYRALGNGANKSLAADAGLRDTWYYDRTVNEANRRGPYPTWYNSGRVGVGTSPQGDASADPTSGNFPANLTYDGGPLVYTMNFGDPDYNWDATRRVWMQGNHAWGESSVTANNGRTRNVTIYYTPGIGPGPSTALSPTVAASFITSAAAATDAFYAPWAPLGPAARTARVPVAWTGIPEAPAP